MSTPAGKFKRISVSIVLASGLITSISRLCVRISKCSCESLSMKGTATYRETFKLRRQRNQAQHRGARALGRADNAPGRLIQHTMIISLSSEFEFSAPACLIIALVTTRSLLAAAAGALRPASERIPAGCALNSNPQDPQNDTGANGQTTLANSEATTRFQRHRRDQLHLQVHVVARHHHLDAFRQGDLTRHVHRADVELRPVAGEEGLVPPAFVLAQHVHLAS